MDAAQALADLTEISSQIRAAVLFDDEGAVVGSTLDDERARQLVAAATELLEAARQVGPGGAELVQVEAATDAGSVFLVGDGSRRIVATTAPEPTVGLVFYDLKSCLRGVAEEEEQKPKRAPRRRKKEADGDAT